jgi:CheY-specific phosphatase CheX
MCIVMEDLLGQPATPLTTPPATRESEELSCAIAMTGDIHGVFQVTMGARLIKRCYVAMTGTDTDEPGSLIDTCGEVGNMLAGRVATVMESKSLTVEFFPPMVSQQPVSAQRAKIESIETAMLAIPLGPSSRAWAGNDDDVDVVHISVITMKGGSDGHPHRG